MRTTRFRSRRLLGAAVLLATGALAIAGCFNPFNPLIASHRGTSEPPPIPSDPRGTLDLFKWCYEHRAYDEYSELFTDDYTFQFSEQDSAGNAFRDRPWTRTDELASAKNLFQGGGSEPAADKITLTFTNAPTAFPDHRPGKTAKWHQEMGVQVQLTVERSGSTLEVQGPGTFYFVRGDSAAIPQELKDRGFKSDSLRWYIERWEDNTLSGAAGAFGATRAAGDASARVRTRTAPATPAGPTPTLAETWGLLKAQYLN